MDLYILTLALDDSAGVTLRTWLRTILEESAVAGASSREIVLAAAEAVNNAVRHSAPKDTTVTVTMSIVGHDVYLRVTDREKAVERPVGDADWESEPALDSSLGLTLMQGLMDEVALHEAEDGTTVRLVKRLRLAAGDAAPRTDDDAPPTFLEAREAV